MKPKTKPITVEGLGQVHVRSVSQLQLARRATSYRDPKTGELLPEEAAKDTTYKIIDQLTDANGKPLFTDADFDQVAAMDAIQVEPLLSAIDEFNETVGNDAAA